MTNNNHKFLQDGGEMGVLIRATDWAATPLGAVDQWPASLKIATGIILSNTFPMYIAWGPQYTQLYNDSFRPILGASKHPQAMGTSSRETFSEIWETIGPMFKGVMEGKAVGFPNFMVPLHRNGYPEDCFFDFSYSPIKDEDGRIGGVLVTVIETTEKIKSLNNLEAARLDLEQSRVEIEQQRDRLKHFFMQAPAGICILDGPDLVFELVNKPYQQLFPGRVLLGKPLLEALPELKHHSVWDIIQDVYRSGKTFEGYGLKVPLARTDNGRIEDRYFNFIYQARQDARGKSDGIMVFVFEVTDMVAAGIRVEESEKRFRAMVETSPVPMLVTRGADMVFEEINTPMLELIARDSSIKGLGAYTAMPELTGQPIMKYLQHVFQTGEEWTGYEIPIAINKNGIATTGYYNISYKPMIDDGKITGVLQSAFDVTDQVNARKKLEKAEDTLKLALQAARLGTFDMDLEKNTLDWDERCRELFGISHAGAITYEKDFVTGLHPDDRERIITVIEKVFIKSVSNGDYDVEYRTVGVEDHKLRWVRAMGKAYFDENEKPIRFIGSVLDITEAKQDEIRKNDFIGMVSHELKTPLTSLKAYVQLLQAKASRSSDIFTVDGLAKVNIQVNKMTALINGFLNASRLESGKIHLNKEMFRLDLLIQEVVEEIRLTNANYHIVFEQSDPTEIFADREKIGSVLNNLLSNAVKYSSPGKTIRINNNILNGRYEVSVQDEGMGISERDQEKLFERYYRVERSDSKTISGFGIGLYLSAEIISRHHGKIWVDSELGKGSVFSFSLPVDNGFA